MAAQAIDLDRAEHAALRPITAGGGRRFWALVILLSVPVVGAVGAYVYQVINGLGVTGLSDEVPWGMYEANLVTFVGVSYGGAVISAVLRLTGASWRAPLVRMAEAMALVTLAIGAIFPIIHIGHPERLWRMILEPNFSSPLVWDMIAIGTYLVATLIFLFLPLIPDLAMARDRLGQGAGRARARIYRALSLGWSGTPSERRVLIWGMLVMAILIIPLAVSVHSVLAWAFGLMTRPGWHSTLFAPYFVVAALLSGTALVILVVAAFRRAYHLEEFITEKHFRNLAWIMLVLGLGYLYLTISELLTEGYGADEHTLPYLHSLLLGDFSTLYWTFIILGGAVPTVLVILPWTRNIRGIVVAASLAVVGMWLKRILIVVPPLAQSQVEAGATATYTPSAVEWLISLGAIAAIPLGLMIFFRVFPILAVDEMREAAEAAQESEPSPAAQPAHNPAPETAG